jgi:hypothetical protein
MEEESSFAGFRDDEIEANYLDKHGLRLLHFLRLILTIAGQAVLPSFGGEHEHIKLVISHE